MKGKEMTGNEKKRMELKGKEMKGHEKKRKEMEGNDHSQQQGNPRSSRCSKCASNQLGEKVRLRNVSGKSMNFG